MSITSDCSKFFRASHLYSIFPFQNFNYRFVTTESIKTRTLSYKDIINFSKSTSKVDMRENVM